MRLANPRLSGAVFALTVFTVLSGSVALAQIPYVNNPLVPDSAVPGGPDLQVTINGTGFGPESLVLWNGQPRSRRLVNGGQMVATILASDIASPQTATVTVRNAIGVTSNPVYFSVTPSVFSANFPRSPLGAGQQTFSLVSADFNRDGLADLAYSVNIIGGARGVNVFLGQKDGSFVFGGDFYTLAGASALIAADLNGDGKVDLAVANGGYRFGPVLGGVSILLGNGDGTFQPHQDFATPLGPVGLVAGDFNRDLKLDLALAISYDGLHLVSLLFGNGDGTFQSPVNYVTGAYPDSITTGDLNDDATLDLITATTDGNVSVLFGYGDGTFQNHIEYPAGYGPESVQVADLNRDGILDLAVANQDGNASVMLGNGDATFQPPVAYAIGGLPEGLVIADLNADGFPDLAVVSQPTSSLALSIGTVSILYGRGDGTFAPPAGNTGAGPTPWSITAGDFNNDGKLDLAIANGDSFKYQNGSVLSQSGP